MGEKGKLLPGEFRLINIEGMRKIEGHLSTDAKSRWTEVRGETMFARSQRASWVKGTWGQSELSLQLLCEDEIVFSKFKNTDKFIL